MTPCPLCGSDAGAWKPINGHAMRRCSSCTFVFATDRHVPANLYEEAYTSEGEYGGLLASAEAQKRLAGSFDWMHEWVINNGPRPFGQWCMLDLGCGVGSAAFLAQRAGWNAHGQDTSENAMRVAREVFGIKTCAESIDQIAERFELVTAFNLVEHIPDPMAYLRNVRRLVTDDGYFGIVVPNYDSYAMQHTTNRQWLPPFHLNFFTLRTLASALESSGFRLEKQTVRLFSWSGVEGPRWRKLALLPYLVANGLIGRLRGNGIVAIARAV